jgi:predicted GNAT family acetyltransferase
VWLTPQVNGAGTRPRDTPPTDVRHFADAQAALDVVAEPLGAAGAEGELSLGLLRRLVDTPGAFGSEVTMIAGEQDARPVVFVLMTGDHPAQVAGFADPGVIGFGDLVAAMLDAGRRAPGVNGARHISEPFAQAWSDVAGAQVAVGRDLHAFELRVVRPPTAPPGAFRVASADDTDLLERWTIAFAEDIAEAMSPQEASETVARMLPHGDLALWERDGELVSMAAVVRRTPWSSSVAYVYTPPPLRRRGYASAVVAELSQRELDAGQSWCSLFTDAANPTSNHIYTEIGYEPRCDFRYLTLTW